ncbi:MAG: formate dehydrogenase accessory protein FdhE [bacterium]|jgi:hypothetical protein
MSDEDAALAGKYHAALAGLVEKLEALAGLEYVADDYVAFRIAVARAQADVLEKLRGRDPPSIDIELVAEYFDAIRSASNACGGESAELRKIAKAAAQDRSLLEDAAARGIIGAEDGLIARLAEKIGIPEPALAFVAHLLASPFAVAMVPNGKAASAGRCPRCGSGPALAKLRRGDGKRVLYCSLCGADWEHPRLVCPDCGNDDPAALKVLFVSRESPRFAESCAKCELYIKTIDERRLPEGETVLPFVEETATLYLDLLAEKEGLRRNQPLAAAFPARHVSGGE